MTPTDTFTAMAHATGMQVVVLLGLMESLCPECQETCARWAYTWARYAYHDAVRAMRYRDREATDGGQ